MAKFGACKYSTFQYGTGDCGAQPVYTGALFWMVNIAWSGAMVSESDRFVGYSLRRGRRAYLSAGGDTFEGMQPGSVTITLDNFDGRYDPYNSSSPLYGSIKPGRDICVKVKDIAGNVIYPRFMGRISDIRPSADRKTVTVTAVDYLQWLYDQDVSVPEKLNIKASAAIGYVLDAAKYPYPRSIRSSNLPIYIFDPTDNNALTVIREVTDASLGTFFVTADGVARYVDLGAFGGDTSTIDQAKALKEITIAQPWENVRNQVKILCTRRGMSGTAEILWSYGNPLYIAPNTGITIDVTHDEGMEIAMQPSIDYVASATPGVSTPSITDFNISITRSLITKTGCRLYVFSTAYIGLYINRLQIRGYKYYEKQVKFTATDASSISEYGPRRFNIDSPWLQDRGFGSAYATVLKDFLKASSKSPIIHLENRFPEQFGPDLLDRIHLDSAKLGIDNTFDIGGIEEEWLNPTGQGVRTTFYLQTVLYTNTTPSAIPPEPYFPEIPPVPPDPPTEPPIPGGPGADPMCRFNSLAPATGPYSLGSGEILNGSSRYVEIPVRMWFRPWTFTNRTRLEISGKIEKLVSGAWVPMANNEWAVKAYDASGYLIADGAITGSDSTHKVTFDNIHARWCEKLRIDFLTGGIGGSNDYRVVGGVLASGEVQADNDTGISFTLNNDGLYAGYATGLWSYSGNWGDGQWDKQVEIDNGHGWLGARGAVSTGSNDFSAAPENELMKVENYDNGLPLLFFIMNGTTLKFRVADSLYPGNLGSMTLTIYAATSGSDKRIQADAMNLFNVCEGSASDPNWW